MSHWPGTVFFYRSRQATGLKLKSQHSVKMPSFSFEAPELRREGRSIAFSLSLSHRLSVKSRVDVTDAIIHNYVS